MKRTQRRARLAQGEKLIMGMAASSNALVVVVCAARQMGGPALAAGVGAALVALAAALVLVLWKRSPESPTQIDQNGAVEALSAL
ncbi:hypothetical protein [Caulobacter segnis]|uniref:hypothetical protein n=1 Tax=Caulobacter segnis TaxID=88688 RepID=UPI00285A6FD2|nr:hypothetical protein [Caulobacter segnis]MDR6626989.1 hypothetical protein [Caulobacter segnis]